MLGKLPFVGRILGKLPLVGRILGKLPFVGRIFWTVFPIVFILIVLAFWLSLKFIDDYTELTNADVGGSIISGIIFSYLVHLWLLPGEEHPLDDELDAEGEDASDAQTAQDESQAPSG